MIVGRYVTEVMYQPSSHSIYTPPSLTVRSQVLHATDKFCYMGSLIANDTSLMSKLSTCIKKASVAFGKITKRLWNEHGIKVHTKVSVYRAVVIPTFLYGCETWTLYSGQVRTLKNFHMHCLRRIPHLAWRDKVTNNDELH